jgi:hypothetical protein
MKKVCVILVGLLLLVSMSLSAEGKFTMWGEGILYPFYKVGDAEATAGWGPDGWAVGDGGPYNEWHFGYDGENYGFYSVWAFEGKNLSDAYLHRFAAWYQPFDIVKVTLGAPRIADYRLATKVEGAGYTRLMNGDYGMTLQLMPLEGLSLGATMFVDTVNDALDIGNNFGLGASYTFTDIAKVVAQYRSDIEEISVGADIMALEGIGLVVAYAANWSLPDLAHSAFVSASMGLGPVNLKADAAITYMTDFDFGAVVNGEFAMDKIVLGASIGYDTAAVIVGSGEGTPGYGFSLFPYVKANFANDSYLKVGFVFASGNDSNGNVAEMGIPILYVVAF